jgi:hypothetical protein
MAVRPPLTAAEVKHYASGHIRQAFESRPNRCLQPARPDNLHFRDYPLNRTCCGHAKIDANDPKRKSARINICTELCVEIRFYVDRNGLSGSAHVGRLELVAIAGEHAHVTPRRNRTVVSCENT